MERSLLYCTLAALLLAGALSSCQKSPATPDQTPGGSTPIAYSLSIPAAFEGEDPGTKALEFGTGDKAGWLVSTFRTTDNIYVYNKTQNHIAQESGYTNIYLHPDADGPTANLAGTLKFWKWPSGYQTVEVGDVFRLEYKNQGAQLHYNSPPEQTGSFNDLNRFDFGFAEVTVTGVSGTADGGYTITTGPAVFQNTQSMFKFTFTGLPEKLLDPLTPVNGIKTVTIHSDGNKLSTDYTIGTGESIEHDITINFDIYNNIDGFSDPSDRREANGPGVVYAALHFLPLDNADATDLITFTVTCIGDDRTYVGSKASPKGGFQLGKYYTSTISLSPVGAVHGHFTINDSDEKVYFSKGNLRYASGTWSFFDNQWDYYTSYSANAWDKFGWSTSSSAYGVSTSNSVSYYSGDFVDWGATIGPDWRTLTSDEWNYLLNTRSGDRYCKATVNSTAGLVIFPDGYSHPAGVTTPANINTGSATFTSNNWADSDWTAMEAAGCVFLPAAGARNTDITASGAGYYWSSTTCADATYSNSVLFMDGSLEASKDILRYIGLSVRLVQDLE